MADNSLDSEVISVDYSVNPVELTPADFRAVVYAISLSSNTCAGLTATVIGTHASKYFVCTGVAQLLLANITSPGSFSAQTIIDVTAYFAQSPEPSPLRIIVIDAAGGDTLSTVITLYAAAFPDFFCFVPSVRTITEIAAAGTTLAALSRKRLMICQTNATAAKSDTTTFNATALGTAYTGKTSCVMIVTADANGKALGYAGSLLGGDISVRCPPAVLPILETAVDNYDATNYLNIKTNNGNVHMRLGKNAVLFPGYMLSGNTVESFLTAAWSESDLRTRMANFATKKAYSKTKTRMNVDGQKETAAVHTEHIVAGITAEFFDGTAPWKVVSLPISNSDRTNLILRTYGEVKELRSARKIVSNTKGS